VSTAQVHDGTIGMKAPRSTTSRLAGLPGHLRRRMIEARAISIPELVQDSLDAIASADPAIHAFVSLCPERALVEGHAAQKLIGTGSMPLLGLPLAVKDAEPVAGLRFTSGPLIYSDRVATVDSAHVARLRAAGAIVIGKTNTPEFTLLGETRNRLGPDTCNPWNQALTAGGSSGGSAAAIAAGMVPLATGSDTAGSITVPSAFCGVFGFKPSHRRIPVWPGAEDWAPYADVGPITRSVADAALMLTVTSGPDRRDPVADMAAAFADLGHGVHATGPDVGDPGLAYDLLGAGMQCSWQPLPKSRNCGALSKCPERVRSC
jgi:amidase